MRRKMKGKLTSGSKKMKIIGSKEPLRDETDSVMKPAKKRRMKMKKDQRDMNGMKKGKVKPDRYVLFPQVDPSQPITNRRSKPTPSPSRTPTPAMKGMSTMGSKKSKMTLSPSQAPTMLPSVSPTKSQTLRPTGNPTGDPTNQPTANPPTSTPSTNPTAYTTSSPTSYPSTDYTPLPCRCDEEGNCLSRGLPPGVALNLCIFAPQSFEFNGIESFEIVQGDNIDSIIQEGIATSTGLDITTCFDNLCMFEIPVNASFYEDPNYNSLVAKGAVNLQLAESMNIRDQQLDEDSVTSEFAFDIDVLLETMKVSPLEKQDIQAEENNDPKNVKVAAWLVPLLVISITFAGGYAYLMYRARNAQAASE